MEMWIVAYIKYSSPTFCYLKNMDSKLKTVTKVLKIISVAELLYYNFFVRQKFVYESTLNDETEYAFVFPSRQICKCFPSPKCHTYLPLGATPLVLCSIR